jgi:hypothetical protein
MLFALCVVGLARAAIDADQVKQLPGWEGALPSKMYSGFLDSTPAGETSKQHMHYIFFESERNPATDPLLIWSNGGPGAGSEFGLFTELGPLELSDASLKTKSYNNTKVPSLFRNKYAWTKFANILIYDSPPPVGFSYCGTNVGGDGYSCGDWDDYRTAKAAHTLVENWLKAFPEYAKHDLYLSGESYAGVYIPMLAREILDDTTSPTKDQLKGFAIGDGCAGTEVLCGQKSGPFFHIEFFHGHGQFSDKLYNQINSVCGLEQLQRGVTKDDCKALLDKMDTAIGGSYAYNLYDECGAENVLSSWRTIPKRNYWSSVAVPQLGIGGALNDYPCGGVGAMLKWLNTSEVQKALHVPSGAKFFLTDNGVGFNYNLTEKNLMPFYQRVAENTSLRVLLYNGDTDPGINSFVSQNWSVALGFKEKEAWRPWTLDGCGIVYICTPAHLHTCTFGSHVYIYIHLSHFSWAYTGPSKLVAM